MPTPSLETPTEVIIKVENYTEVSISDFIDYTFYINAQEYKRLPLDANVREPNPQKSKPYRDMINTLKDSPEKFLENNLGITVVATKVEQMKGKKFKLTFTNGTGILNGGHTQQAILDSKEYPQIAKAIIKISVRKKNYELSRIAEIAAAQNSSTAVKEYSLAEKKGLFIPLKHAMPNFEKHIIWYEGHKVPNDNGITPNDLIALLNAFNIDLYKSKYNPYGNSQPTSSSNSKGTVFSKWENEVASESTESKKSFPKLYPLAEDILLLSDFIRHEFYEGGTNMSSLKIIEESKSSKHKPLIFTNEICKYNLPSQFLFPLISAFRANIYYDETNQKIGWYRDNCELFLESRKVLCEGLRSSYNKTHSNNINKCGSDPQLYEILFLRLQDYIDYGKEPEIVYEIKK